MKYLVTNLENYSEIVDVNQSQVNPLFDVSCDEDCDAEEEERKAHELVEEGWHFSEVVLTNGETRSYALCGTHSTEENLEKHSLDLQELKEDANSELKNQESLEDYEEKES